ncbi:MAG TPA: 3-hydroxyacyl-ACP dehydratase FabZ [Rudaea sp.]|nr:3-hydroxyacyl-ACP dehydratase FabZ [Rudaea sp.]
MTTAAAPQTPLDVRDIAAMLPHRFPFLLVDRVVDYTVGERLRAIKNVTINEPFFQGHFPGHPVMPGVLIIEALAQACGLLVQLSRQHDPQSKALYYLVKVDNAKFTQIVGPGDQLQLEVELKRMIRSMGLFHCRAKVDGKPVAEAELMCAERNA